MAYTVSRINSASTWTPIWPSAMMNVTYSTE